MNGKCKLGVSEHEVVGTVKISKFVKKIKIRIFRPNQVFYTFQTISDHSRRKIFFRPLKNFEVRKMSKLERGTKFEVS